MSDLMKCLVSPTSGNIITPRGRMYFCTIAEKFISKSDKAKGKTMEKDGKYSVSLVVPPEVDLTALRTAIKAKAEEKWGAKLPANLKSPIRKCSEVMDDEGHPKFPVEMANFHQIAANTFRQQPNIVDDKGRKLNELIGIETKEEMLQRLRDECYSGRWARISVNPGFFDTDGNRGIKLWLQNVQLFEHDEPIGGGRNARAEDDFAPVGTSADATTDSIFG
jgi:hypothetical protein